VRSGIVLPAWLDHDAVQSVVGDFPPDLHWSLVVRIPTEGSPDAVELSTEGPVDASTVLGLVARLGCEDRLLQRSLAMIPPARCRLGVSVRWSASGPLLVAVRFGALQQHFDAVQAVRRMYALAAVGRVALDVEVSQPGVVQAAAVLIQPTGFVGLSVERWVEAAEVPAAVAAEILGPAIEVRYFLLTDAPLVGVTHHLPANDRTVASEWQRARQRDATPEGAWRGIHLDGAGTVVARSIHGGRVETRADPTGTESAPRAD